MKAVLSSRSSMWEAVYSISITLWIGGLFAIGYLAVPVLFAQIPDRMQAGHIAAVMFSVGGWVGIACASMILLLVWRWQRQQLWRNPVARLVVAMLVLGLIGQFYVQPAIAALKAQAWPLAIADSPLHAQFARWHGVSSVLYLLEALLGLALVVLQKRGLPARASRSGTA